MNCMEWTTKLDAYVDGELDGTELAGLETHLRACPQCASESLRRVQWKRAIRSAGQRYQADPALRERVQQRLAGNRGGGAKRWSWQSWATLFVPFAAMLLITGVVLLNQNTWRVRDQQLVGQLVDLHVATLASSSPVDVVSSDKHTVKPWFEGKIPFTFNLPELSGSPYELVGGKVTYIHQSPAAELVFRIRKHQVTGYIVQEPSNEQLVSDGEMDARSFHLESWKQNGLHFFLVGDVGVDDLRSLRELLRKAQ